MGVQAETGTSGGSVAAQREELWRKAAALRKKIVRVVRAAEDGPSKGDLLWARAVFYLPQCHWWAGGTVLRFLAERRRAIQAQIDREARDVGA